MATASSSVTQPSFLLKANENVLKESGRAHEAHVYLTPPWEAQAPRASGLPASRLCPLRPLRPSGNALAPAPARVPAAGRPLPQGEAAILTLASLPKTRGQSRALQAWVRLGLAPAHRAAPAPCSLVTSPGSLFLILPCTAETPRCLAGLRAPLSVPLDSPGRCPLPPLGCGPREALCGPASLCVPRLGHCSCLVDIQVHAGSVAQMRLRPRGGGVGVRGRSSSGQVSWGPWARWE